MTWNAWYDDLIKPAWTPSPATIGLIWTLLYPIIALSFGFVFLQTLRGKLAGRVALPFGVNLLANLLFMPIFDGLRDFLLASVDIVIVWGTIVWSAAAVWKYHRWVAAAQLPYFIWVSLATVLQLSIASANWGARMIRLGLCCIFRDQPIKFVRTTATALVKLPRADALAKLSALCAANAEALWNALQFCAAQGIGCFRINSQILPVRTHPGVGYAIDALPGHEAIVRRFKQCGGFAQRNRLRTSFHPDQFVVLNSQRPEVVEASLRELEYQAEVAEWVGADVINVHGGGAFGDKRQALADFARNLDRLSQRLRSRLTVENDDTLYTPADLLPVCRATGIPLVYDVHHHRCNPDGLTVEEATLAAIATWTREPLFHLSSPIAGWDGATPERHHDLIDVQDFPTCWRGFDLTVEVEAKAKEVAVLKLKSELQRPLPAKNKKTRNPA